MVALPLMVIFILTRYIPSALQFMVTDLWDAKPCVLVHEYQTFEGIFSAIFRGRLSQFYENGGRRTLEKPALTRRTFFKAANLKLTVLLTSSPMRFNSPLTARAATASASKERASDVIKECDIISTWWQLHVCSSD